MKMSLGVGLVLLAVGCAHAPGKSPGPAASADGLAEADRASRSYAALDFPACTEQYRQAAESCADAPCRASAF